MHIIKKKKSIWKAHILCNFKYITLWKRKSYGDRKGEWFLGGQRVMDSSSTNAF